MSEGQEDGDGVGEDEGDGAGGVDNGQGEYEDWEMVVRSRVWWEKKIGKPLVANRSVFCLKGALADQEVN